VKDQAYQLQNFRYRSLFESPGSEFHTSEVGPVEFALIFLDEYASVLFIRFFFVLFLSVVIWNSSAFFVHLAAWYFASFPLC
jgi:hypothetical protein